MKNKNRKAGAHFCWSQRQWNVNSDGVEVENCFHVCEGFHVSKKQRFSPLLGKFAAEQSGSAVLIPSKWSSYDLPGRRQFQGDDPFCWISREQGRELPFLHAEKWNKESGLLILPLVGPKITVLGVFTPLELPFTTGVVGWAYHWTLKGHKYLWSATWDIVQG